MSVTGSLLLLSIADVVAAAALCHFIVPGWEDELNDESARICHDGSLQIAMFLWKPGPGLAELAPSWVLSTQKRKKSWRWALLGNLLPDVWMFVYFLHLRDLENCSKMQNSTEETVFARTNPH